MDAQVHTCSSSTVKVRLCPLVPSTSNKLQLKIKKKKAIACVASFKGGGNRLILPGLKIDKRKIDKEN